MEEAILVAPANFKLYNDRSVYLGTFLGGPLAAGYFAAENFKRLGQGKRIGITWLIAIIATVVVFGSIIWIPAIRKVPNFLIPLVYTLIAQLVIGKYQGNAVKDHVEAGGNVYSLWRAAGIGILGGGITLTIVVAIVLASGVEV